MNTLLNEVLNYSENELENSDGQEKFLSGNYSGLRSDVEETFRDFQAALFPLHVNPKGKSIRENLETGCEKLINSIELLIKNHDEAERLAAGLIKMLPEIRKKLMTDITAAYRGDPAAKSLDEIILSYPAFTAISAYRIAHALHVMDVPLIPRIMTEYAHSLTGIDIHPGAEIGEYFFIDHGTGVVIGETTVIGRYVKLYQNVTLGAKSFDVNPDGSLVKGIKRHPNIGNDVVIYAGATILGGDTKIGNNCVIGGNVWLTHSVQDGRIVIRNEE